MDESRKQFETWVINKYQYDRHFFYKSDGADYVNVMINDMWEAWQASRAAIELELPKTFPGEYNTLVMYVDDVESSLESAGIKVKE